MTRKAYICMLCQHREGHRCHQLKERLHALSPQRDGRIYVERLVEFKTMCIQGQIEWTPEEKRKALKEVLKWRG